jgi:uncharacterized protein YkwD
VSHPPRVYAALVLVALGLAGSFARPPAADASACAAAHATPGQASRTELARAVVCVSNAERRRHGLHELKVNSRLSQAAQRHSRDMVRRGYFAHTGLSGDTFVQRIRAAGYLDSAFTWLVGENLAWGWGASGSPGGILKAWLHSPEHRKILLRPSYREVGVGVALGGPHPVAAPDATFTADFGITN